MSFGAPPQGFGGARVDYDMVASRVWGYGVRFTNVVKLVEGLDNSTVKYFDTGVLIPAGSAIVGKVRGAAGKALLVLPPDAERDLVPSATETVLLSGFDPTNMKDHDDSTYARATADQSYTASTEVPLIRYDFGAVAPRAVYLRVHYTWLSDSKLNVYASSDGSSWSSIISVDTSAGEVATATVVSFRYLELRVLLSSDISAGGTLAEINTLEVYDLEPLPYERSVTIDEDRRVNILLAYSGDTEVYYTLYVARGEPP